MPEPHRNDPISTITVVGLGYVGLPTAVAFARAGLTVRGLDIDQARVDRILAGENPLTDAELPDLAQLVDGERFVPTTEASDAVPGSDAVLLAVPTPVNETRDPDLSIVEQATRSIAEHLDPGTLVVLESTVYPGCTEETVLPILEAADWTVGEDVGLAYCPERLNPGDPEHGVDKITRVLGAVDEAWAARGKALYERVVPSVHLVQDLATAEAAKVIENVQRDLNIALVNELSLIFDRMGIDVEEVLDAAATKWNFHRYHPGPGVGGHCLPVDPYYLTWKAQSLGIHPQVILAGRAINDAMPGHVVNATVELLNELGKPVNGTEIAVLGLAYKANTADTRNAPAQQIVERLTELGGRVRVADPHVDPATLDGSGFELLELDEALDGAQVALLVVGHDLFKKLGPEDLAGALADPGGVIDTIAQLDPERTRKTGLAYRGIGRR